MYTVFDIETTGLSASYNDIIQFAYLRMSDNFVPLQSEVLYFWYPGMKWGAEEIHHIPESRAYEHKDEFDDNLRKMYTVLSGAEVVGHNCNTFDVPFCTQFLARNGLSDMQVAGSYDTMHMYRPVYKKRMKLGKLAEELGIKEELISMCCESFFGVSAGAHDAAYDTTMTELIFAQAVRSGVA